jgi:phospholipid transport system substrate-binding protein
MEDPVLRSVLRPFGALFLAVAFALPAAAQPATPTSVVERFNAALLDVMQNADQLGFDGRYERLDPVMSEIFDFRSMAQFAVGANNWQQLSQEQQEQLVDAFRRMSIASYAGRFDGYSGQSFRVIGEQDAPRGTKIVQSQIVRPNNEPVALGYVLRQSGGEWRILDIMLGQTVSELSRTRSEYSSVLSRQGFDALISNIEAAIERQRSG